MRILVTGGCGYIGSHTVVELLRRDNDVIILDNFSNSDPSVLNQIEEISAKNFHFYNVDIRDRSALENIFTKHEPEGVIHFAALKSIPDSIINKEEYFDVNINGTEIIVEFIKKFNTNNLIFSSSASVYGNPKNLPIKENSILKPTNPYALSKMKGEEITKKLFDDDQSKRVFVLRYFNPIGAHKSGLLGEKFNHKSTNLVPLICNVIIGKMKALNVCGTDYKTKDGTGIRDYIHINDLVTGHLDALNHAARSDKGLFEVINLGTGQGYSVLEVISAFEKITMQDIPRKETARREGDIAECYADVQLAKEIIGWSSKHNLSEMCEDTCEFLKKNY